MSEHSPSNRAALRTLVVVALALTVVGVSLPDISRVWQPSGDFGLEADPNNIVTRIEPAAPADKAGIKVGDRVDIAATEPRFRIVAANSGAVGSPGQAVTFAIVHGSQERYVTVVSKPFDMDISTRALVLGRELAMLVFVVTGAALVLLRPSIATWGFYIYCLGLNGAPSIIAPTLFASPWNWLIIIVAYSFGAAGWVGVAVFAALFLHEPPTGWRAAVYRLAPLALLISLGLQIYVEVAPNWFGWPANVEFFLLLFLQGAMALIAVAALVGTYISAKGNDRQRIRWVVLGFGIALLAAVIALLPDYNYPYWVYGTLQLIGVVVPLTVAYAVIRHRVIDVSFVVSRTLVYGVLTSLLVGSFALVDWLFIDKLKLARLGTVAELGVAVAGGFWFNGLHRRVDSFIDATFFRQRHKAEVQLAKNAAALPFVTTTTGVAQALVAEPIRTLSLASAALFRRGKDGLYVREESQGWTSNDLATLDDADDRFLALVQAESGPLSVYDHPWRTEGVPSGPAHPVLALPIVVRRELAAIVLYGAHIHGEALDPDEIKAIAGLASGAAAAYDHLEAESAKRNMDSMTREIESLRTQLAESQI
jgi:hypothetical protein